MKNEKVIKIIQSNKEGMEIDRDRPTDRQSQMETGLNLFVIFCCKAE